MFTDDDFKMLKDEMSKGELAPKWCALLLRLEAAEKVIMHSERLCESGCQCPSSIAWEAWRKACGK